MQNKTIKKVIEYYEYSLANSTPKLKSFFIVHTPIVVKIAKELAKERNADEEVVEISAWLHDISSVQGNHEQHDIKGVEISEKLLRSLNYPKEKLEKVIDAILNHRGSKNREVRTKESQILIDADALSHFQMIDKLKEYFYPTNQDILNKLKRTFAKMSLEAKERVKNQLEEVKKNMS